MVPPQPEYVLVRDKARKILYLAKEEFDRGNYSITCFLAYLARILLNYSIMLRRGVNLDRYVIDFNEIRSLLIKDTMEAARTCLEEGFNALSDTDKLFMEKREKECECWGE